MKRVAKKVPLFRILAKKDTLISDLSLTPKKYPFLRIFGHALVTQFVRVIPPGYYGLQIAN